MVLEEGCESIVGFGDTERFGLLDVSDGRPHVAEAHVVEEGLPPSNVERVVLDCTRSAFDAKDLDIGVIVIEGLLE